MSQPLRLAVIGLGRIGAIHALHAQRLAASGRARIAALVDADLTRAEQLAVELGGDIATFSSVQDLVASHGMDTGA